MSVSWTYLRGSFQVGTVLMDNEFEKLRNLVPVLTVNTTAAKEHVPCWRKSLEPVPTREFVLRSR